MEVARRNNGFRKVAKWVVGAAVVAGAASGNVLCNEVSEPQESEVNQVNLQIKKSKSGDGKVAQADITFDDPKEAYRKKVAAVAEEEKLLQAPDAVIFKNVVGKTYTNKEIDGLVDRTGLKGTKGVIQHELGVRRAQLLREMEKFNSVLEVLPKEIAEEAGKYPTYDKLKADLAKEVKWNYFNKKTFGLMEQVPQNLADEMLKCDIYEGFPGELIDKIRDFLHPFDPSTVIKDEEEDGKRVVGGTPAAPPTPAISGSTEVTEKSEKTKDAIKESDDSVNEGKGESKKGKSWLAKLWS